MSTEPRPNAETTTPRGGTALQKQYEDYPKHFRGRVPKNIRMLCTVTVPWPLGEGCLERGKTYEVTTNSYGAVAAYSRTGLIGVKPFEFEVLEWYAQTDC